MSGLRNSKVKILLLWTIQHSKLLFSDLRVDQICE